MRHALRICMVILPALSGMMVWYSGPEVSISLITSCRFCFTFKRLSFCPALHGHPIRDSWQRAGLNEGFMHIH